MNAQEQFWAGEFGTSYTSRNRVDWRVRCGFWQRILRQSGARSVHEVGCNAGWNMSAMRRMFPDVEVYGNDLNDKAVKQATLAGLKAYWMSAQDYLASYESDFDLVCTVGVLIHVSPVELKPLMQAIVRASADYVLAVEYASETEQEIPYRGHAGALWKRPFGRLYEDIGLKLVYKESLTKEEGFDDCTAWLLRK